MASEEPWVGIPEVAAHLQVAKDTVYRWIDTQGLPAHRVGRLFRFRLSEVDDWVKADGDDSESSPPSNTAKRETQRRGSE